MNRLNQTSRTFSPTKDARIEVIGLGISFGLIAWAVIGEFFFGVYGGELFLPFFMIPVIHLLRFMDLDTTSFPYAPKKPSRFFDRIYPILVVVVTFASIPFLLAISGVKAQDTFLNVLFTGSLEHTGIHHGWAGWYLVIEGYLYHRINRHAAKRKRLGEAWRNGLFILGMFLFLDDFWGEQVAAGALRWPDIFLSLNGILPFSWDVNFAIEIGVIILIILVGLSIYFHFKQSDNA